MSFILPTDEQMSFLKKKNIKIYIRQAAARSAITFVQTDLFRLVKERDMFRCSHTIIRERTIRVPWWWCDCMETCRSCFNLLKTKRILLYITNQSVPRCKHFPPRL